MLSDVWQLHIYSGDDAAMMSELQHCHVAARHHSGVGWDISDTCSWIQFNILVEMYRVISDPTKRTDVLQKLKKYMSKYFDRPETSKTSPRSFGIYGTYLFYVEMPTDGLEFASPESTYRKLNDSSEHHYRYWEGKGNVEVWLSV